MINQEIKISGIGYLNGVQIDKVPKFLADSTSETTHAIQVTDLLNASHPLITPLQLQRMISYFDVHSPRIAEHENEEIPKIHLTPEEPTLDPSTN